jgi:hypothetical protein
MTAIRDTSRCVTVNHIQVTLGDIQQKGRLPYPNVFQMMLNVEVEAVAVQKTGYMEG